MGNYGVITGAAAKVNLVNGTTQLALASIANEEGVRIATNQFFVDGIGNYLATVRLFPNSIGAGYTPTIQIWNATSAAVAGSRPMPVPVSYSGFYGLTVEIPFNVTNTAHAFQIRIVVPGQVRFPNICALAVEGGTVMQAIIASTAANADGGLYGSGADGDANVVAPLALVRDFHYNNLSVGGVGAIDLAGFRLFVRGTLTLGVGAVISANGAAGGTSAAGGGAGAAAVGQTIGAGSAGGAGGVAGAGVVGVNAATSGGGNGGAGGAGGAGAGGAAGTVTAPTPTQGGPTAANAVLSGPNAAQAALAGAAVATLIQGGAGGGGGGGAGAVAGGGGGGGGGIAIVAARNITGTGTIRANGGAGGAGAAAVNAGGGGGGGGGFVVTVSNANLPATVTVQALGGAGGIGGAGGGVAGAAGAVGSTVHVKLGS
jgi:hypothetical protein